MKKTHERFPEIKDYLCNDIFDWADSPEITTIADIFNVRIVIFDNDANNKIFIGSKPNYTKTIYMVREFEHYSLLT